MRNFFRIMVAVAITVMSIAGISATAAAASTGSITGYVRTDNGTALAGAWVQCWNFDDPDDFGGQVYTDTNGFYTLTNLDPGGYRVKANAVGYYSEYYDGVYTTPAATRVDVTESSTTSGIDFNLGVGSYIRGTVYQEDGTTPIVGAQVLVYENITDGGTQKYLASTSTIAGGTYSVTAYAGPGDYFVMAQAKGWAATWYDNQTEMTNANPVTVTAGVDRDAIDITLPESGYILGTVYQADGVTPLGLATIDVRVSDNQSWVGSARSANGTGEYYFNVAPGTYRIMASASGYLGQWYDNFTIVSGSPTAPENWNNATPVSVVGVDETPDINFSLLPVQEVETNAATGVWTAVATLNGTLNSKGANDNVTVCFEWGTATGVYTEATDNQTLASVGAFSASLTGLTPATTYYFRAKAVGDVDTDPFYGSELTFTTNALGAPVVVTDNASNVATTSATLNGNLTEKGTADNVSVSFEWGDQDGGPYPNSAGAGSMSDPGAFSADLSSLTPGKTYYYIAKAVSADGSDEGDQMSFTTSTTPPTVTTGAATAVTASSVTLNGNLTDRGTATSVTVSFAWGTQDGGPYPNPVAAGSMSGPGAFSADLSGLSPGTNYYYIAIAEGAHGSGEGTQVSFATLTPPSVTTDNATSVATTSATLNGTLNSKGSAASVIVCFEWGTAAGGPYTGFTDNQTPSDIGAFTANLTGLTPGTTYYCRAKADGDGAPVYGDEVSFTTLTTAPTVTTAAATNPATTSATLNGNLGALGTATSVNVSFEWGTTTSYGTETTAQSMTATGAFTANLTGLTPNTTYHFRAKAVGQGPAVNGEDMTFTTASLPDTTAPTISAVASSSVATSGATITWTTNESATSRVEYGLTEEYGSLTSLDTNLVTSHSVDLTGLKGGKTYHFRVISKDASNNEALSVDYTFKTESASSGMPAWAWVLIGLAVVGAVGGGVFFFINRGKAA